MSTTAPAGHSTDKRILGVIGIGHGMSHVYYLVLPPIFLQLREAFNVSYTELGMVLAIMPLASAIVQVPVGFMVDRMGARTVLAVGFMVVSIATALMGLCTSFWQIVLLSFISGAGNAVFHPTDYAILNSSINPERMGRAFSLHTFTGQLGSAAAPAVMIALTYAFGWRMALIVIGLAGIAALALVVSQWSVLRDDVTEVKKGKGGAAVAAPSLSSSVKLLLSPGMLMFFLFFMTLSMMQSGIQAFAATALVALHDTPVTMANVAVSVFLFASAAGVLLGGELADRTSRHEIGAAVVFAVSAVFCVALAVMNLQGAALMGLMTLLGLGQGSTRPARDMMLRAATPKGSTGSVFGFVTSGIAVGSALAPIPLGWMIDIGRPEMVFHLLAGLMVLALVSMYAQRALMPVK